MTQVHLTENSLSPEIPKVFSLDSEFIIRIHIFDSMQNPHTDSLVYVVKAIKWRNGESQVKASETIREKIRD